VDLPVLTSKDIDDLVNFAVRRVHVMHGPCMSRA
jgi:hypothetical protein